LVHVAAAEEALFEVHGDAFVATPLSTGPWDRNALHGGPVAALVAREIERARAGDGKRIARLTLELERPVPLAPLTLTTAAVRSGGRIEIVDAEVRSGDVLVTRARALRIREAAYEDLAPVPDTGPTLAGPDDAKPAPFEEWGWTAFHSHAVEMRMLGGRPFSGAGAAVAWIRPTVPVIAGEVMSPFQRAAAVGDFGNGISAAIDPQRFVFINPDLTISAHRPPVGEWICLDAFTSIDPAGVGLAQSALHDEQGEFGRAVQLLYVAPR
jgi:hypothetical protein